MKKHQSIKLASAAFAKLSQVFYSETYNYAEQLLAMRKGRMEGTKI